MDGLGIPIIGVMAGFLLSLVCSSIDRLRRFTLAALVSPFIASVVFILGAWIIVDDRDHDGEPIAQHENEPPSPNAAIALWLGTIGTSFVVSSVICNKLQRILRRS